VASNEYHVIYQVKVTKNARKQGLKTGLSEKSGFEIIADLKELKYWPKNREFFDYETVFEALEFKYYSESKWIRVVVFQDEVRKTMWVIRVIVKKQNTLNTIADRVGIETAVREIKADIRHFQKEQARVNQKNSLNLIIGGQNER
jgi:hypothetical protein